MVEDIETNIKQLKHLEDVVMRDLKHRLGTHESHNDDESAVRYDSSNSEDATYNDDEDLEDPREGSGHHRTVYVM